jgi:death-on-curing protein
VSIEYVDIVDYIAIATEVTGLDTETIIRLPNLALAESALHAPAAGFGEQEFYPDFIDKAAVLITRLARNHPPPDGNKPPPGSRSGCSSISTVGPGTAVSYRDDRRLGVLVAASCGTARGSEPRAGTAKLGRCGHTSGLALPTPSAGRQ